MQVLNSSEIKRRFKVGKTLIYFCKTAFFTMQNSVLLRAGSSACLSAWCEGDFIACGSCSKVRVCIGREQTNSGCVWQEG